MKSLEVNDVLKTAICDINDICEKAQSYKNTDEMLRELRRDLTAQLSLLAKWVELTDEKAVIVEVAESFVKAFKVIEYIDNTLNNKEEE